MDDLQRLEDWVSPLLARLSAAERRALARAVARDLRAGNMATMRAQQAPDGSAWAPRKNKKTKTPNKPMRWLYKARDGHVRELEMGSYRGEADRVIGYDKEAGGIRTMLREGMLKKRTPQHGSAPTAAMRRRAQHMMLGLVKNLRASATSSEAVVAFASRAERIARVHHFGLKDRVKPGGPDYDYPARQLLGITDGQIERVRDMLLQHLAGKG